MDTLSRLWNECVFHGKCVDLIPSYWSNALVGEAGEFANWIKKLDNPDKDWNEDEAKIEHADVFIYWVLMAKKLGWTLDEVIGEIYAKLQELKYNADS